MFTTIRRVTADELNELNEKAAQFIERHAQKYPDILSEYDPSDPYSEMPRDELEGMLLCASMRGVDPQTQRHARYLARLWKVIFRRVTKTQGDAIAWGYIGYSDD